MELSGVSEWDQALQKHTISLLDQSVDPRSFEARRDTLLWVVQRLRQFVEQTTNRRSASPNLATLLQTAVIPALDDFYPQDEAISITEELIEIICEYRIHTKQQCPAQHLQPNNPLAGAVGQGHADIMRLMQKIGVFHTMVWVVMHPTTQKVAANCLGRLVNAPGRAGSVAQVLLLTCKPKLFQQAAHIEACNPQTCY